MTEWVGTGVSDPTIAPENHAAMRPAFAMRTVTKIKMMASRTRVLRQDRPACAAVVR